MYTGWVNEEDEYLQGRGGECLGLGNLEDEDGNKDNNKGREGKGGTTTTPSTPKATCKDKKMSETTTAAYYYYFFPPDGFELGTNVGKKLGYISDGLMRRMNMYRDKLERVSG